MSANVKPEEENFQLMRGRGRGFPCLRSSVTPGYRAQSRRPVISKKNLSDLKVLNDLKSVCTKDLRVKYVVSPKPKSRDLKGLKKMLFAGDMYASAKEKWTLLFDSAAPQNMEFPTTSRLLSDLVITIRNNAGRGLYKNGTVKMLLSTFMRLGSDDDFDVGVQPTFFTRISTTNDPTTDACGLKCSPNVNAAKREDALNGVPDSLLEGSVRMMMAKPFAVGEGKGVGPGEAQLLGGVIKCWAIHGVYPIGLMIDYSNTISLYYHDHSSQHHFCNEKYSFVDLDQVLSCLCRFWELLHKVTDSYKEKHMVTKFESLTLDRDGSPEEFTDISQKLCRVVSSLENEVKVLSKGMQSVETRVQSIETRVQSIETSRAQ